MEKITSELIEGIINEVCQTPEYEEFKKSEEYSEYYSNFFEEKLWFGSNLSEERKKWAAKSIAIKCNPEKILLVLALKAADVKEPYYGIALTDTAFYYTDGGLERKNAVSYANIESVSSVPLHAEEYRKKRKKNESIIKLKDGRTFNLYDVSLAGVYFISKILGKIIPLCADMPKSKRIKTIYDRHPAENIDRITFALIAAFIILMPGRCMVRAFYEGAKLEKEKKVLMAAAEEKRADKSNYTTKNLLWFENYGRDMGSDYQTDPVLIRIPNLHAVRVRGGLYVSDNTQRALGGISLSYSNHNVFEQIKAFDTAGRNFTAYCEIQAGMLSVNMVE